MSVRTAPTSRPLRALGIIAFGWTMMRVVMLWPGESAAGLPRVENAGGLARRAAPVRFATVAPFSADRRMGASVFSRRQRPDPQRSPEHALPSVSLTRSAMWTAQPVRDDDPQAQGYTEGTVSSPTPPGLAPGATRSRFSGSAWMLMRGGGGAGSLASGGQLGGSQAGVRIFYAPGPAALALTARISTPLAQRAGREVAVGVALRGHGAGIIFEQRLALDRGGRNAPAVIAYGGVSDVALPGQLKLDGYVQAGVVGIKSAAAFVDGAVRVERTVLRAENASLAVGAGAWGGAQPGVMRIDVGPQIVAHLNVADTGLRVSAEWRQRIAGDAAPSSGPSMTVGFDF